MSQYSQPPTFEQSDVRTEVLLQVPCADLHEFHVADPNASPYALVEATPVSTAGAYQRHTAVCNAELLVLALYFTSEQLQEYGETMEVPVQPGAPTIVVACGDYKLPVAPTVVACRYSVTEYVFSLPALPIGISFAPTTPPAVLEAFEFILRQYGAVENGTGAVPRGSERSAEWAAFAPPPPSYSLEMAQAEAMAAQKAQTLYVAPQRLPGSQTTLVRTAPNLPHPPLATRVAHGITTVSRDVGEYIAAGTRSVTGGISSASTFVQTNTAQNETPVQVPTGARVLLSGARTTTKGVAHVSGTFAKGVIKLTSFVASKAIGKALDGAPGAPQDPRMEAAREIVGATVGGAAGIVDVAMESTRVVLKSSCDGVQTVVTHKMGDQAGEAVGDGLGLAQDVYQAQNNVRKSGMKSMVKATAKATLKQTASDQLSK